jgi:hypothetical protein
MLECSKLRAIREFRFCFFGGSVAETLSELSISEWYVTVSHITKFSFQIILKLDKKSHSGYVGRLVSH